VLTSEKDLTFRDWENSLYKYFKQKTKLTRQTRPSTPALSPCLSAISRVSCFRLPHSIKKSERWFYHRRFTKHSKEQWRESQVHALFLPLKRKAFLVSANSFSPVTISSLNAPLGPGNLLLRHFPHLQSLHLFIV
jgi:hypothetical protein